MEPLQTSKERKMNPWSRPTAAAAQPQARTVDQGLRSYMLKVYNYMASGVLLTGIVAYFAANSETLINAMYAVNAQGQMSPTGLGWLIAFAPLGFVLFLGFRLQHMSYQSAQLAFWGFASLMGLSLMSIFLTFTGESIARVFFITAAMFGGMSIYGYTTNRDLTSMGSFLIMGVWGILLASVVNIFLGSSLLHFAVSILGVFIFLGLTAYDTQKLKSTYYQFSGHGDMLAKSSIMGALSLYLDFINLFIMMMRLFGERR